MQNNETETEMQINQILNIVKIASLSFPAIAFLQYYSIHNDSDVYFFQYGFVIIAILTAILLIYVFWTFLQSKVNDRVKRWIDPTFSLSIAFCSVIMTGSYQSNYKFLFLFVIISSSIECSRKAALTIAGLSAAIILGIDLVCVPKSDTNAFFESDIILACVFLIISWTIGYYVDLRKRHIEDLKDMVNVDGLTSLYNHRHFYDYLSKAIEETRQNHSELSLLFIDIDNFKCYNDLYGHPKGDVVLKEIAVIMQKLMQRESFIARYGGEEFAILFPDLGESSAIVEAERLRKAVQEHHFDGEENLPGESLTISVGVATFPTKAKTDAELIKNADEACYRAKFLFKNRVETYYSILEEIQNDVYGIDGETVTSIKTLIAVINAKDKYTYGHVERVVFYSTMLAEKLKLSESDKKDLIYAAYLHDIGKINVPEEILMKVDPLTNEEWDILKNHPRKAVEIIENIQSLQNMVPIVLQHHERYDGTGYPNHLKGEQIHFLARILTVVDSFDAMTSVRPYQPKKTFQQAINELKQNSGTQFDPTIVRAFISAVRDR